MRLILTPTALDDLQKAIRYYNQQQKGLGSRFEHTVDSVLRKIKNAPGSASFAYDSVRYKVVDKFPFIITYEELNNHIYILRVFNTHRDIAPQNKE